MRELSFPGPHFRKYPLLVAELLYGGTDPKVVGSELVAFAETYDDTEDFIPVAEEIARHVLEGRRLGKINRRIDRTVAGFASEAQGADCGWYVKYGCDCPAALFLSVTYLCYCDVEKWCTYDVALQQVAGYALRTGGSKALMCVLWALTFDVVLACSWEGFIRAAFSHASVSVAGGLTPLLVHAVRLRVLTESDRYEACEFLQRLEDEEKRGKNPLHSELQDMWQFVDDSHSMGAQYEKIQREIERAIAFLRAGLSVKGT